MTPILECEGGTSLTVVGDARAWRVLDSKGFTQHVAVQSEGNEHMLTSENTLKFTKFIPDALGKVNGREDITVILDSEKPSVVEVDTSAPSR